MSEVTLREIVEVDLPHWVAWFNDPEVTEFTGMEVGQVTLEGERRWFQAITAPDYQHRNWQIDVEGTHIGGCALTFTHGGRQAELGIVIGEKAYWGKGYGTAAIRGVLRRGFAELKLHRIYLHALAANIRGIRCYEKCGFRHEGLHVQAVWKRGEWRDAVSMAILKEEWEGRRNAGERGADGVPIRSYRSADHEQVCALWEACGFHLGASDAGEALARKLCFGRAAFFVAEAEGTIVATAMGAVDGVRAWVNRVAVHPEYRRRGLARRLLTELEQVLRHHGACYVNLLAHEQNEAARALYESLGYQAHRQLVYMSKPLA